jgi:hypothetical protein
MIKKGKVPPEIVKYGTDVEHIFILAAQLKAKYGKDFEKSTGAIGMITTDRLNAGLQQLMAGARFALKHISRDDLVSPGRRRMFPGFPTDGYGQKEAAQILARANGGGNGRWARKRRPGFSNRWFWNKGNRQKAVTADLPALLTTTLMEEGKAVQAFLFFAPKEC